MEAQAIIENTLLDRRWFERLLEIMPGFLTWLTLIGPVVLSIFQPVAVAYIIIAFDLFWLVKSFGLSYFLVRGYRKVYRYERIDWLERLNELEDIPAAIAKVQGQLADLEAHLPRIGSPWQWFRKGWRGHKHYVDLGAK